MAELADAQDLGSCGRKAVGVQVPPSAPRFPPICANTQRIRPLLSFSLRWSSMERSQRARDISLARMTQTTSSGGMITYLPLLLAVPILLIPVARILRLAGYSRWWCLLALVPVVNIPIILIPVARVLRRAGHTRWWCLVALIPLVNLVCLWIVAYAPWAAAGNNSN